MKPTLFSYLVAASTVPEILVKDLTTFLVNNRRFVMPDADRKVKMSKTSMIASPMAKIYDQAILNGKDTMFSLVQVIDDTPVPEVVTFKHLTLDTRQLGVAFPQSVAPLKVFPEYKDKIILNITGSLTRSGDFIDQTLFQNVVVRDLLSRSFHQSTNLWLSAPLIRYACKIYSITIASAIGSMFNISPREQSSIAAIFAYYFLSECIGHTDETSAMLRADPRAFFGMIDPVVLTSVLDMVDGHAHQYKHFSLDVACTLLGELGITRLKVINRRVLMERLKSISPDPYTSALALEYPPVWAYLILLVASGRPIGLTNRLKQFDSLKNAAQFATDLIKDPNFIPMIE